MLNERCASNGSKYGSACFSLFETGGRLELAIHRHEITKPPKNERESFSPRVYGCGGDAVKESESLVSFCAVLSARRNSRYASAVSVATHASTVE